MPVPSRIRAEFHYTGPIRSHLTWGTAHLAIGYPGYSVSYLTHTRQISLIVSNAWREEYFGKESTKSSYRGSTKIFQFAMSYNSTLYGTWAASSRWAEVDGIATTWLWTLYQKLTRERGYKGLIFVHPYILKIIVQIDGTWPWAIPIPRSAMEVLTNLGPTEVRPIIITTSASPTEAAKEVRVKAMF